MIGKTIIVALLIVLIAGCDSPVFEPEFTVTKDSIHSAVKTIVKAKGIYIEAHKTPVDETIYLSLSVQLINAEHIPSSEDSIIKIQKKVATKIKSFLKDQLQFDEYKVIFVKRDTARALSATITHEEGMFTHTFRAADLKN